MKNKCARPEFCIQCTEERQRRAVEQERARIVADLRNDARSLEANECFKEAAQLWHSAGYIENGEHLPERLPDYELEYRAVRLPDDQLTHLGIAPETVEWLIERLMTETNVEKTEACTARLSMSRLGLRAMVRALPKARDLMRETFLHALSELTDRELYYAGGEALDFSELDNE